MKGLRGALLVLGALLGACGEAPDASDSQPTAPGFTLEALDGSEISLHELRGRAVVIDFWATWCAPCVHQIPVLNAFQAAHPEEAVVLGISVDAQGREVVARFAEEHDIRYRVLLGDESLAQQYGAFGFPSLFVVGPDGGIGSAHVGVVSAEELEHALAQVNAD